MSRRLDDFLLINQTGLSSERFNGSLSVDLFLFEDDCEVFSPSQIPNNLKQAYVFVLNIDDTINNKVILAFYESQEEVEMEWKKFCHHYNNFMTKPEDGLDIPDSYYQFSKPLAKINCDKLSTNYFCYMAKKYNHFINVIKPVIEERENATSSLSASPEFLYDTFSYIPSI